MATSTVTHEVCGDEHAALVVFEVAERQQPVALLERRADVRARPAVTAQAVRQTLRSATSNACKFTEIRHYITLRRRPLIAVACR